MILRIVFLICVLMGLGWGSYQYAKPPQASASPSVLNKQDGVPQVMGAHLMLGQQRFYLHGINYYPQNTPWESFWPQFQPETITQDLIRIQKLGFNTVRIFVPFEQFGGMQVKPEMKQKLLRFLNLAHQHDLKVVVTLFDFFVDYANLAATQGHLEDLLKGLETHPALLAWDLKNEGDADYKYGKDKVVSWLQFAAEQVRRLAPGQLVTAGWQDAAHISDISPFLDYVTFHFYGPENALEPQIEALKKHTSKPIVLGEYGFHTWSQALPDAHIPEHQYNYFNAVLAATTAQDLAGSMVWNLYDYAPKTFGVQMLSTESFQHHMGVLDTRQRPKSGLKALQQALFVRDAQTHYSVGSDTRSLELVLRSPQEQKVSLLLKADDKVLESKKLSLKVGVNRFSWTVTPAQLSELLSLRQFYMLESAQLLKPDGQQAQGPFRVWLREK